MPPLPRRYKKKLEYSYTLGVYPTLDLLENRPDSVIAVYTKSTAEGSEGISHIKRICKEKGINTQINDKALSRVGARPNTYALAMFKKFTSHTLDKTSNHVVLVNPANAGNVGTIMRTMLGFGFHNLAIISPGVDIFNPEVVRSSMGALFKMNIEYFDSFNDYSKKFSNNIYTFQMDGKVKLPDADFEKPYSLVFGNEGHGLSDEIKKAGSSIAIPQSSDIDSLNLALSVAISLYEAST